VRRPCVKSSPPWGRKLSTRPEHRIHAGRQRRFRVIYQIDDARRLIIFHHVEDRKNVYRWLG
jgi:mRNA-degrading endonuclease RelE of RelBE toxin-antitoxin system